MIPLVAQSRYGMANSIMSTTKRMVTTFSALFVCSFKLSEKSALGYRFGAGFLWRYVVKQGMCREQKAISGWVWCNDQACLYAKTRQQCWLVAYFLLTLRCEVRLRLSRCLALTTAKPLRQMSCACRAGQSRNYYKQ